MMNIVKNKRRIVNGILRMRGFTLIEIMVSTAIFISVITIATGALYSAQSINIRLEQTQTILDEVNLAMEVMVRDIRYGTTFYCDTSLPASLPSVRKSCTNGSVLVFRPAVQLDGSTSHASDRVAYYVSDNVIYKKEYPYGGSVRTSQITSSAISVTNMSFFVTGAQSTGGTYDFGSSSDLNQPLVMVSLSGVTVPSKRTTQPVTFNVETSASSREVDN